MVRTLTAPGSSFTVTVSPRGASRLKDGHVWVYRSDIVSADGVPPGSLVTVTDHRGQILGSALYSTSSQIAVRLISRDPVADYTALLLQKIAHGLAYHAPVERDRNAYRFRGTDAAFLPRLIAEHN